MKTRAQAGQCLVVLFLLLFSPAVRAENAASIFDAANKLYEQGKFAESAASYEKLTQSGQVSAAVLFNLGNAFLKSGQLGRAVAAYRKTAQITPRDPDLRANLQFARNQVQGTTVVANKGQRFLSKLTVNEWTLLASGAIWGWLLLLCAIQLRPALRLTLRGYVIGFAIAIVVLCSCLGSVLYENSVRRTAVVVIRDAPVHNGPLEESQKAFVAHDGAELRILDRKDEWLQVSAGPGRIGWLRRDQAVVLPRI